MPLQVKAPRRNLPISCTRTCYIVCLVYFAVYLAVLGYLPWQGVVAQVESGGNESNYIMATFCERMVSKVRRLPPRPRAARLMTAPATQTAGGLALGLVTRGRHCEWVVRSGKRQ